MSEEGSNGLRSNIIVAGITAMSLITVQFLTNMQSSGSDVLKDLASYRETLVAENQALRNELSEMRNELDDMQNQLAAANAVITQMQADRADADTDVHEVLTSYYENIPLPAWLKKFEDDGQLRMVFINDAYAQMFGVSKLRYEGRTDSEVWGPAIAEVFREKDERVLRLVQGIIVEETWTTAKGSQCWRISKFPVRFRQRLYVGGLAISPCETP